MEKFSSFSCGAERKGIKMEWCEKIYGEWRSAEGFRRLERTAAVFILLVLAVVGIEDRDTGFPELAGGYSADLEGGYPADPEAGAAGSALSGNRAALQDVIQEVLPGADEILSSVMKMAFESIPGELPVKSEKDVITAAGTAEIPTAVLVPEEQDPSAPGMPLPETAVPILPEDGAATDIPAEDFPSESLPEESEPENSFENIRGFLVDTSGMICGIADTDVISEGYLVLPGEGCSGIRASAFADVPEPITEIYIPGNITRIEEGAFAGLRSLEWLEAEGSDACFTEDGVLFSENGTCILGFPSARTGSYKVPDRVTRFASDVFEGAQIETLDAVGCSLTDTGNLPSSIRLLQSGDLPG